MRYGMKQPCPHCPYLANEQSYLGPMAEDPEQLHLFAERDVRVTCHLTKLPEDVLHPSRPDAEQHHCAGALMYMSALGIRSSNLEAAALQDALAQQSSEKRVLVDGAGTSQLVEFHAGLWQDLLW